MILCPSLSKRALWPMAMGIVLLCAAPALAAPTGEPNAPRTSALTLSMTSMLADVYEAAWERAWGHGLSTVVMGGTNLAPLTSEVGVSTNIVVAGLQGRYTFVGDFNDGMGVAIVGRYFWISPLVDGSQPHSLLVGPHLFWRISGDSRFTIDYSLGCSYETARLEHPRGFAPRERETLRPTGSLNLGWSFGP